MCLKVLEGTLFVIVVEIPGETTPATPVALEQLLSEQNRRVSAKGLRQGHQTGDIDQISIYI